MMIVVLAFSILTGQAQARPDPAAELAAVRTLYGAASFDEALARLSKAKLPAALLDQADTYRALCLLALGRSLEAERTIELLVRRNPAYLPDEADVSPKLVQVFRSVRARVRVRPRCGVRRISKWALGGEVGRRETWRTGRLLGQRARCEAPGDAGPGEGDPRGARRRAGRSARGEGCAHGGA